MTRNHGQTEILTMEQSNRWAWVACYRRVRKWL